MNILKNIFLLALILILSFGGGFYFGAFPDHILEKFGLSHGKVRWICTQEICPSEEILLTIQKQTQIQFQMIETLHTAQDLKASSIQADIILAPRPLLLAIKEELSVYDKSIYDSELHSDFSTFVDKDKIGIPLFWQFIKKENEKSEIKIYSIGFFQESKLPEKQKNLLIQSFLSSDVQLLWLKERMLSATKKSFDQSLDLKPEQKPSHLRQFSLQDIIIEE